MLPFISGVFVVAIDKAVFGKFDCRIFEKRSIVTILKNGDAKWSDIMALGFSIAIYQKVKTGIIR